MIEFAIVMAVKRRYDWTNNIIDNANRQKNLQQDGNDTTDLPGAEQDNLVITSRASGQQIFRSNKSVSAATIIDIVALIFFLLSYSIFNYFYWIHY